jgi:hypothetical protein
MDSLKLNELQLDIITQIRQQNKIIAARCGWGSGKTSALVLSLLTISHIRPGTSSLLVTDTTPRYNSVLMPEIEKWLAPLGWTYNHTLKQWSDPETGSPSNNGQTLRPARQCGLGRIIDLVLGTLPTTH